MLSSAYQEVDYVEMRSFFLFCFSSVSSQNSFRPLTNKLLMKCLKAVSLAAHDKNPNEVLQDTLGIVRSRRKRLPSMKGQIVGLNALIHLPREWAMMKEEQGKERISKS